MQKRSVWRFYMAFTVFFNKMLKKSILAKTKRTKLEAFQEKLAGLHFLDPACGSGNFLTESYIALRKIENEILKMKMERFVWFNI